MENKLYIGNLSYDTTEDELRVLFSSAGTVTSVTLIKDRATGRSKGFAFVEMSTQEEAEQAIKALNGASLGNRELKVDKARPPEDRSYGKYDSRSKSSGYNRDRKSGSGSRRY